MRNGLPDFGGSGRPFSRRQLLRVGGIGCLGLTLPRLLGAEATGEAASRVKSCILIFHYGGPSHIDTFDYKPKLRTDAGKRIFGRTLRDETEKGFYLIASPFKFTPRGTSGHMISEVFPRLGDLADDFCIIRTLHTDIVEHFQGVLAMHTGSATVPVW